MAIQGTHLRMNGFEIRQFVPERLATANTPASPLAGQEFFDTTVGANRQYISGGWRYFAYRGLLDAASDITSGVLPAARGGLNQDLTAIATPGQLLARGTGSGAGGASGIAAGTAGQVLQSNGDNAYPSWVAPPSTTPPDGSITTAKLADSAVTSAKIADLTIVLNDLSDSVKGLASGGAAVGDLALRSIGYAANQALAGSTSLQQILANNPGTNGATLSLNNQTLTGLNDPVNVLDAANKRYVDGLVQGLTAKQSVRVASTANSAFNGVTAIDGVTLVTNDRVLLKNQTNQQFNGIYIYNSNQTLTRSADMDSAAETKSAFVFVEEGTVNQNTGWLQTADNVTLNTTALTWVQFSSAGVITAGDGLYQTGNQFAVNVDNTTLQTNSGAVQVKNGGINANHLADNSVALAGTKVTGTLPVSRGGTGGTTAAQAQANLGIPKFAHVAIPALTADTWTTVTHNLATTNTFPMIQIWENGGSSEVTDFDIKYISTIAVQVRSGAATTAGAFYLVAMGV